MHEVEWSGVLFIRQLEGNIHKPDTLKFEGLDFFPMDVGTTAYTDFTWNEEIMQAYEENPSLEEDGVRVAMIHSHHSMPTYFSGTDIEELEDNTPEDVDMWLSLVVNNKFQWSCCIALQGQQILQPKFKSLGGKKAKTWKTVKEDTLFTIKMNVFLADLENLHNRVTELRKRRNEKNTAKATSYQPTGWAGRTLPVHTPQEELDFRPHLNISSGGTSVPEFAQLLCLSTVAGKSFDQTIEWLASFNAEGASRYMKMFENRYEVILEELATIYKNPKDDVDDYCYDTTIELRDELLAHANSSNNIFSKIIKHLDVVVMALDEKFETEAIQTVD